MKRFEALRGCAEARMFVVCTGFAGLFVSGVGFYFPFLNFF